MKCKLRFEEFIFCVIDMNAFFSFHTGNEIHRNFCLFIIFHESYLNCSQRVRTIGHTGTQLTHTQTQNHKITYFQKQREKESERKRKK